MKTFILGVGAQKAGTSWLHSYIKTDPNFINGSIQDKELHIWDYKYIKLFQNQKRSFLKIRSYQDFLSWKMENSSSFYFDYFKNILSENKIAADITPSYAALSTYHLNIIKQNFKKRNINVKCIFLLRDPVQRCISAFSMNKQRPQNIALYENVNTNASINEAFIEYFQSEQCKVRTEYEKTIKSIKELFNEDEYRIYFFEDLFNNETILNLSNFLNIHYLPDLTQKKINEGSQIYKIEDQVLIQCANFYAGTYSEINTQFPQAKNLWTGYKYF